MTTPGGGLPPEELAALLERLVPPVATADTPKPLACSVCGERLDPVLADVGTHALCDPDPAPPEPPPSTLAELHHVLRDFEASRPRSTQVAIGPSQIAVPCDRRLAYSLAGVGTQPNTRVRWEPMVGTAVHAMIAEALAEENKRLGRERWLVERRVHPDAEIAGNCDAYDVDTDTVIDWKVVGQTALESVRPGPRTPDRQPAAQYRGQIQLYGRGWQRAGRNPRWVRIVFLPRAGGLRDAYEWTAPYDRALADAALERMYRVGELVVSLDVAANPAMWAAIAAEPNRLCGWCPYHRDGGPADDTGCPGDTEAKARSGDKFTEGLIAP